MVGTDIDVTERKRAEAAFGGASVPGGCTEAEPHRQFRLQPRIGKTLYWSEELFRIFKLDPARYPRS